MIATLCFSHLLKTVSLECCHLQAVSKLMPPVLPIELPKALLSVIPRHDCLVCCFVLIATRNWQEQMKKMCNAHLTARKNISYKRQFRKDGFLVGRASNWRQRQWKCFNKCGVLRQTKEGNVKWNNQIWMIEWLITSNQNKWDSKAGFGQHECTITIQC